MISVPGSLRTSDHSPREGHVGLSSLLGSPLRQMPSSPGARASSAPLVAAPSFRPGGLLQAHLGPCSSTRLIYGLNDLIPNTYRTSVTTICGASVSPMLSASLCAGVCSARSVPLPADSLHVLTGPPSRLLPNWPVIVPGTFSSKPRANGLVL